MALSTITNKEILCYHCGEVCIPVNIKIDDKNFCCEGCKTVFQILNQHALCDYYKLNENPGLSQRVPVRNDKFEFLNNKKIQDQLISFRNETQLHITFYLPQMHCSSCLYLLENLHRFDEGIISSKVNFTRKEVDIVLLTTQTNLKKVAEILTSIGYEPYISLNDLQEKRPAIKKSLVYQLGVAGFCFGNIMLMSFPEYFGIDASEYVLRNVFRIANFLLAIPVLLYASLPFFSSSWNSLKHKFLNIDTPIALAILITFIRSAYEVISGTGSGYFDSMSGIVFFMLAGRILQDKTYRQLSFDRDYSSYFPVAVAVLKGEKEVPTSLPDIKPGDSLLIHHEELIPADSILTRGQAFIDYSFVTGESLPVLKEMGEIIYAGGKQTAGNIELLVVKEVAQSYLTKLWNQQDTGKTGLKKEGEKNEKSFVHLLSRYFTYIVLLIATATAVFWSINDPAKLWPAVTAVFIIACPCALLLSNSFTNGNILRILGRNHFYLKNAQTIEEIAQINHIVFDKTGTLTSGRQMDIQYEGYALSELQLKQVAALAASSTHPLSRALVQYLNKDHHLEITGFREETGRGIEAFVNGDLVKLGSAEFFGLVNAEKLTTKVYAGFEDKLYGIFTFSNHYRHDIPTLLQQLKMNYQLSVISGDNEAEKENLQKFSGKKTRLLFNQKPENKLMYIQQLQQQGEKVMMIGDGLNDAAALKQSDVGIALTEQSNNFTPASDAIIHAKKISSLVKFIRLCRANRNIIIASFILSIVYNIIGIYFAVQGTLSPLLAAILMPSSSLSIVLLTFGSSNLLARKMKLL